MHIVNYKENDLPIGDLETVGLAADGKIKLGTDDLDALLSGRRTGMIELHDLESDNIRIKSINAKISLRPNENGTADLLIHPVYRKTATPDFLDPTAAIQLQKGEIENYLKTTTDKKGNKKELLVEFDPDTREFIVSDTEKILVPDMVNNEFLTAAQKENYRKGREVKLPDGTSFNYSATDAHGIRSDKIALIASIMIDGGLTYLVYKGLNALFNQKRDQKAAEKLSPGYYNAVKDVENQRGFVPDQATRSYTRSGGSR